MRWFLLEEDDDAAAAASAELPTSSTGSFFTCTVASVRTVEGNVLPLVVSLGLLTSLPDRVEEFVAPVFDEPAKAFDTSCALLLVDSPRLTIGFAFHEAHLTECAWGDGFFRLLMILLGSCTVESFF